MSRGVGGIIESAVSKKESNGTDDGVAVVFGFYAFLVFILAGATVTTSLLSTESVDEWVVVLLFCFMVSAVCGACVHAAWRWRSQAMATAERRAQPQGAKWHRRGSRLISIDGGGGDTLGDSYVHKPRASHNPSHLPALT